MKIINHFPIYTVELYQNDYCNKILYIHTDYKRIKQLYNQEIRERLQYDYDYTLTLKKWYVYNNFEILEQHDDVKHN